ncbi:hypothetical protein SAMN05661012_04414 [Chitinophaga sancti]|uniref:Uncharacterized protein n=1 Tax=Chitinophaga sancti TaxID=1004 RepID=A0A1K1RXM1_9BACT|nr:hypothetical protein SAMN05661012_04414 [Chitinophaga sancti]
MLHLKTDHTFRNRFLFVFLFLTILCGLTASANNQPNDASFRTQTVNRNHHASFRPQAANRPHINLHKPGNFFIHLPHFFMEDILEDLTEDQVSFLFRATEPRHKRRFYISVASQQYSFTTRLQQLQLLLDQYVPGDEDKTGIYQWQDAFLPAYYKFLFRYTLF